MNLPHENFRSDVQGVQKLRKHENAYGENYYYFLSLISFQNKREVEGGYS